MRVKLHFQGNRVRALYCDGFPYRVFAGARVRRASHVETTYGLSYLARTAVLVSGRPLDPWSFWADMTPVQPGIVLGPFPNRQGALDAEVAWLHQNWLAATG